MYGITKAGVVPLPVENGSINFQKSVTDLLEINPAEFPFEKVIDKYLKGEDLPFREELFSALTLAEGFLLPSRILYRMELIYETIGYRAVAYGTGMLEYDEAKDEDLIKDPEWVIKPEEFKYVYLDEFKEILFSEKKEHDYLFYIKYPFVKRLVIAYRDLGIMGFAYASLVELSTIIIERAVQNVSNSMIEMLSQMNTSQSSDKPTA